ncbi:tricarballylate dehydrogenase [Pelotomaculum sp. FP]|uniref:NAD(P)/FAD-dependent oxidoreductase n=1 Tax=Pelotomaculum sp. FP TaxID=261474 RepID=UPI001064AA77|nr:NAD(P)/FAD-dependent oxidoreductase [Pelotomaculum sp. FP]TEB14290.1 tricarballylate dehydrogenase [Pelotomaculum sp. FP]
MEYDLVVIGGGPAGMLGAATAARRGLKVVLLEKNDRLGKKLAITGGGRCNFTNDSYGEAFSGNIVTNGKFLYSALNAFAGRHLVQLFKTLGVQARVEADGRVFPASGQSGDVLKALQKHLKDSGVEVRYNSGVRQLLSRDGQAAGALLSDNSTVKGRSVLVATGGASYQQTGSSGDGYRFARRLGHTIVGPRPALVPLVVRDGWVRELQGLALDHVMLRVAAGGRAKAEQSGELLFTHFGLSGPSVLNLSSFLTKHFSFPLDLIIDFKPGWPGERLNKLLQDHLQQNPARSLKNTLSVILPQRLAPVIPVLAGVDGGRQGAQVTRGEREELVSALKNLAVTVTGTRSLNEAIVTCGGVSVKEINPSTLESKIIRGLYFAGEVIDVDALTGGFNLQIAFSTGYLSGSSAGAGR